MADYKAEACLVKTVAAADADSTVTLATDLGASGPPIAMFEITNLQTAADEKIYVNIDTSPTGTAKIMLPAPYGSRKLHCMSNSTIKLRCATGKTNLDCDIIAYSKAT